MPMQVHEAGLTQAATALCVAGTLEPPMHSAWLSAGHAVSQLAQAPLAGAVQCAGPTCVFRRTMSEAVVVVVHPHRTATAKAEISSAFMSISW